MSAGIFTNAVEKFTAVTTGKYREIKTAEDEYGYSHKDNSHGSANSAFFQGKTSIVSSLMLFYAEVTA